MTIQVSIEHSVVNRLLAKEEANNGSLKAYQIEVKDNFTYPGWAGRPSGPTKAYHVEIDGIKGYLFPNEMDNYFRSDFLPEENVQPNPVFLGEETPNADKKAEEERKLQEQQEALSKRKEAALVERVKSLEAEYDVRQEVNSIVPNFYSLSSKEEFVEKNMDAMLGLEGARVKGQLERHLTETGSLPTLVFAENTSNKSFSLYKQLEDAKMIHFLKGSIDLKISKEGELEFKILNDKEELVAEVNTVIDESEETATISIPSLSDIHDDFVDDWEVTVHRVELYEGTFKESGKEVEPGESALGDFFEDLFIEAYTSHPDFETSNIDSITVDGDDAYEIDELSADSIMRRIFSDPDLKNKFSKLVALEPAPELEISSEKKAIQTNKKANEENAMSF